MKAHAELKNLLKGKKIQAFVKDMCLHAYPWTERIPVEYLEYKGDQLANTVKRYNLTENKQEPKKPHLPEHQQDAMDDYFEDCKFLASFIGCNLFEEEKKEDETGQLTFYLTRRKPRSKVRSIAV